MKKNTVRSCAYGAAAVLLAIAAWVDILIAAGKLTPVFRVGEDFASEVFSGILTFSTLGLSVLSIIISVLDARNYGLRLRDILSFESAPIRFARYIIDSTLLTLAALAAMILNWCTFISALAVVIILYTNLTSIQVFKLISQKEVCKQIVFDELKNGNSRILKNHIINWVEEYKNSIAQNYEPDIRDYAAILRECVNHAEASIVEDSLQDMFELACRKRSVGDAVILVFRSLGMGHKIIPICKHSIGEIQYADLDQIQRLNIPAAIDSVLQSDRLGQNEKEELTFLYFESILHSQIDSEQKIDICGKMLDKITQISADETGIAKQNVICWLFVELLLHADEEISKPVYALMLKSLYLHNLGARLGKSPELMAILARLVMTAFFYTDLTSNPLSGFYLGRAERDRMRDLVQGVVRLDHICDISLKEDVMAYRDEFFLFFMDAINLYYVDGIPYQALRVDTMADHIHYARTAFLWNIKSKAKFAMWFYLASGHDSQYKLLRKGLERLKNEPEYDSDIRDVLLSQFQDDGTTLTEACLRYCTSLSSLYNCRFDPRRHHFKEIYDLICTLPERYWFEIVPVEE